MELGKFYEDRIGFPTEPTARQQSIDYYGKAVALASRTYGAQIRNIFPTNRWGASREVFQVDVIPCYFIAPYIMIPAVVGCVSYDCIRTLVCWNTDVNPLGYTPPATQKQAADAALARVQALPNDDQVLALRGLAPNVEVSFEYVLRNEDNPQTVLNEIRITRGARSFYIPGGQQFQAAWARLTENLDHTEGAFHLPATVAIDEDASLPLSEAPVTIRCRAYIPTEKLAQFMTDNETYGTGDGLTIRVTPTF